MERFMGISGMVIAVASIGWGAFCFTIGEPVQAVLLIAVGGITATNASSYF